MTSLRKKVTSYFRQLSFHNEPRERKTNVNENSFITKYLTGQIKLKDGPPVLYGKSPNDLPNFELGIYSTGSDNIVGSSTGPNGGLTTVKRIEKHLSITDPDIDFIDTQDEAAEIKHKSPVHSKKPLDNTTMVIKVAGQEYRVTNRKSRSLGSLTDLTVDTEDSNNVSDTKPAANNNNEVSEQCKNQNPKDCDERKKDIFANNENLSKDDIDVTNRNQSENVNRNFSLSKSKSECNPFEHRKKGKIIRLAERPQAQGAQGCATSSGRSSSDDDAALPKQWNRRTDLVYGISDSLYDTNQVTKCKNGNPIADCYGVIARGDSAILALADGVNWGEKACIAAKSAIHGCLHYLNKTIFDDTSLFDFDASTNSDNFNLYDNQNTPINTSYISPKDTPSQSEQPIKNNDNRIGNTTEVFISLLRAFNCAHNLILENQGMLTTLTVAVILPLKPTNYNKGSHQRHSTNKSNDAVLNDKLSSQRRSPAEAKRNQDGGDGRKESSGNSARGKSDKYICCVCNVGDTLAYVYSPRYGVRELTKGSHDVYCNRDMRDALGALGPVDGINPELNNLTLSVTTVDAGDIVMIASDGLTDNYDPTVCKYTVNSVTNDSTRQHRTSQVNQPSKERSTPRQSVTPTRDSKPPRERKPSISSTKHKDSSTSSTRIHPPTNVSRLAKDPITPVSTSTKSDQSQTTNKENHPKVSHEPQHNDITDNPLIAQFMADNAITKKPGLDSDSIDVKQSTKLENASSQSRRDVRLHKNKRVSVTNVLSENKNKGMIPLSKSSSVSGVFRSKTTTNVPEATGMKYGFLRSKTSVDLQPRAKVIPRNEDGLPFVTPIQKYELTLLLIEDILKHGISGKEMQCKTAKLLCENLLKYTVSITAAKRHTLEDNDLYFDNKNDILVEVSQREKKLRRKKCLEKVQNLPGKLDHVSVVAYNVGNQVFEELS